MIPAVAAALLLSSPGFHAGGTIPKRFTCDGTDTSPPLRWTRPPNRSRSLAVSLVDPDAPGGTFTHWTLWNVPPTRRGLAPATRWRLQGRNTFGRIGYGGPCPPAGATHHYIFRVWAVNAILQLPRGASPSAFANALRGHVVSIAQLVGRYGR